MERTLFPPWRQQQEPTSYPFAATASLSNGTQSLLEGTFLDAVLYPIGGGARLRLASVTITHETVTLFIGDDTDAALASCKFSLTDVPDTLEFVDSHNRPAGLLISEASRLGIFATWGTGTFTFTADQTGFAGSCCIPTPEVGVRGFLLDDGTLLTGEVWIIGDDGVVVRYDGEVASGDGYASTIRIDVVGDTLIRRRLCGPQDLFDTPRFLKTLTLEDNDQAVVLTPDAAGAVRFNVNNNAASDTVLRTYTQDNANKIEVVGSRTQNVR